jgi:transcriptional regulator with XRE-family HTH domain
MDLKERRIKAGMTQIEVAIAVGVSLTAYRLWEYGLTPNDENKRKLDEVLGHDD